MNPEQLAAIKARAGIGTPTPEHDCAAQGYGCERCQSEADASAADVPALVAEVERLQRIEAAAKAWLQACDDEDASFAADHRGDDADVVGAMDRCESAKDQLRAALRAAGSGE